MSADSLYLKHTRTHTLTHTHTHTHKFTDELQVYGKDVALRISNDADSLSRALSLSLTHTRTQLIDELQLHGKEAAMCIRSVADSLRRPATTCFPRFQICYTNRNFREIVGIDSHSENAIHDMELGSFFGPATGLTPSVPAYMYM